jgi:hypothetical protein
MDQYSMASIVIYFIYPEKYQIKERRKIEGGNNTIHFDILLLEIHFFNIFF